MNDGQATAEFESIVARVKRDPKVERDAQEVRTKYGPMFTPEGIANLDPAMFRGFFRFEENRHWTGIHRWSGRHTADLPLLKRALLQLVDEGRPIAERIDGVRGMIDGFGRAVVSAILQVAHPQKYGVFNNLSEEGLRELGLFPGDESPEFAALSLGRQYVEVNRVLGELARKYSVSLWALDTALGGLGSGEDSEPLPSLPAEETQPKGPLEGEGPAERFALERHLEDFLVENWEQTPLNATLEILSESRGELTGEQFPTGIGRIDLLCRNKDGSGYTIIELKLGQTGDETVGQVQRYMGWVKKNLAKDGQSVKGLIICREADEKLMTALVVVPNVEVFTYEVRFSLSQRERS